MWCLKHRSFRLDEHELVRVGLRFWLHLLISGLFRLDEHENSMWFVTIRAFRLDERVNGWLLLISGWFSLDERVILTIFVDVRAFSTRRACEWVAFTDSNGLLRHRWLSFYANTLSHHNRWRSLSCWICKPRTDRSCSLQLCLLVTGCLLVSGSYMFGVLLLGRLFRSLTPFSSWDTRICPLSWVDSWVCWVIKYSLSFHPCMMMCNIHDNHNRYQFSWLSNCKYTDDTLDYFDLMRCCVCS